MMDGGKQKSLGKGADQDWCQVIICSPVEEGVVHKRESCKSEGLSIAQSSAG